MDDRRWRRGQIQLIRSKDDFFLMMILSHRLEGYKNKFLLSKMFVENEESCHLLNENSLSFSVLQKQEWMSNP